MRLIVERFCRPGQTVCDPWMLDRAGTALACRGLGCTFIGATERPHSRDRIRVRLAQEDDRRDQGMGATKQGGDSLRRRGGRCWPASHQHRQRV